MITTMAVAENIEYIIVIAELFYNIFSDDILILNQFCVVDLKQYAEFT